MASDVAPDGSPVAVYCALPAEPEFTPVLEFLEPPASVLDLGCGVGRLANELAGRGFEVTGVDESPEMLAHLHPAVHPLRRDIRGLRLARRFDVVVLASHLVNVAHDGDRHAFLRAAADHVASNGVALIQHWESPPAIPEPVTTEVDGVQIEFEVLALQGKTLAGRVTYRLDDRAWTQTFECRLLDEDDLDAGLARVGLRRSRRLTPKWLVARPAPVAFQPWQEEDLPLLRALNMPDMKRHLGGPETEDALAARHRRYLLSRNSSARRFRVVLAGSGEPVGSVGYWEREWEGRTVYEMGWAILPAYQRRGLGTLAVREAVLAARAEGGHRFVHAFPSVDNAASNAVCRSAGFALVGECDFEYPPGTKKRSNNWVYDLEHGQPPGTW